MQTEHPLVGVSVGRISIIIITWCLLSCVPGDPSSDYINGFILLHLPLAKIFLSRVFEMLSPAT